MAPVSMAPKQSSSSKDENNSSSSRKTSSAKPQEEVLKCPRCDSQNTKFCYYNNYSLTQPRHFCKTCRRYWTKGGALRNVPIGGGCRKNKKTKPSGRLSNLDSKDTNILSATDIGGLKFFQGFTPAMDFQVGGLNFPRLASSPTPGALYNNQFSSFGDMAANSFSVGLSTPCFSLDPSGRTPPLMGFNLPFPSMLKPGENNNINTAPAGLNCGGVQEIGSLNPHHTSLTSSIESLSSMNQDLHWKLQQQRLAMLFGGENQTKETNLSIVPLVNEVQKPQPILFHTALDPKTNDPAGVATAAAVDHNNSSRKEGGSHGGTGNLSTEWFFDNSYAPVTPTPTNSGSNGNDQNLNNWNGIQAWSNLSPYTAL